MSDEIQYPKQLIDGALTVIGGLALFLGKRSIARLDDDIKSKASVESVANLKSSFEADRADAREFRETMRDQVSQILNHVLESKRQ